MILDRREPGALVDITNTGYVAGDGTAPGLVFKFDDGSIYTCNDIRGEPARDIAHGFQRAIQEATYRGWQNRDANA